MADALIWGDEIADYLIAQGLVRDGRSAQGRPLPPVWVDPDDGAQAPDLVTDPTEPTIVTVFTGPEIPGDWHMGFMQERSIEIRVRAESRPTAELLQRSVRGLMEEKKHAQMGRLLVQQSKLWRGVQPMPTDDESVTLTQSFRVAVRVEDLTV